MLWLALCDHRVEVFEARGIWAGHAKRIVGPTGQRFCSPTDRRFVSCTTLDPKPFALAFPSLRRFLTRRTCLLAPGKNSAAPERTFSSALVSAEWRAQRENDREERTDTGDTDSLRFS